MATAVSSSRRNPARGKPVSKRRKVEETENKEEKEKENKKKLAKERKHLEKIIPNNALCSDKKLREALLEFLASSESGPLFDFLINKFYVPESNKETLWRTHRLLLASLSSLELQKKKLTLALSNGEHKQSDWLILDERTQYTVDSV